METPMNNQLGQNLENAQLDSTELVRSLPQGVFTEGYRLMHQHSYDIGGGQRRYDGIWEPSNDHHPIVWGWRLDHFQQKDAELAKQGYRLMHQHSYDIGGGEWRYDGIWEPSNDHRPIVWGWRLDHFQQKDAELAKQGYRLMHQHSYDIGGKEWRYDGIWEPSNDHRPIVWGWRFDHFQSKDAELYTTRICIGNRCLSLPKMSQHIQNTLNNQTVGYGFAIAYGGGGAVKVAHGQGRTSVDPPQEEFSIYSRGNVASVSKTITAVAVIQLLSAKGLSIDAAIANYLPSDWVRGTNVEGVTFKQLLTHTSGIRDQDGNKVSYDDLKNLIAQEVSTDKSPQYQNQNFALFRVIIPYLNGFSERNVTDKAAALSAAYLDYMNTHVFQPIGITEKVSAKPDANSPLLFYPFPPAAIHGSDFGDWFLYCGGSGFQLSVNELSLFLNRLRFSNQLLNESQRKLMESNLLGWQSRFNVTNGTCVFHGGYLFYPTPSNGNGEVNSLIADFSLGIQVAMIANSRMPKGILQVVVDAYEAAWESA